MRQAAGIAAAVACLNEPLKNEHTLRSFAKCGR